MILEDATYEAFGYYAKELKPHSHKRIVCVCDGCGRIRILCKDYYHVLCLSCSMKGEKSTCFGKHFKHREEAKRKISKAMKGNQYALGCTRSEDHKRKISNGNKGKIVSDTTKDLIRNTKIGIKNPMFGKTFSEDHKHKLREARKHRIFPKYKTKPEKAFEAICINNNLPFHFVGDRSFWLDNMNPDFVHNSKKIVVEVQGEPFHSPLVNRKVKYCRTNIVRQKRLKTLGYKCIFIWSIDLMRKDAEAFVMHLMEKEGVICKSYKT